MAERSILLPDIGEGVTEAELVEWHVKPGDIVREDDVLAAVMTDKATVEIPSLYDGTVVRLGAEVGALIAIGGELLSIDLDGDSAPEPASEDRRQNDVPTPSAAPDDPPDPTPEAQTRSEGDEPARVSKGVRAAPAVRARARNLGIDLSEVRSSNPDGRITHADLDRLLGSPDRAAQPAETPGSGDGRIKVVGLRRRIAERMAEANAKIAHITVIEEVDVTALLDLRAKLNADAESAHLTLLPFIATALVKTIRHHPEMNAHFDDEAGYIDRFSACHIGIATMTPAGLLVPVLRDAQSLTLRQISAEIARLAAATRDGSATRSELTGSTITLTSLGPLGALATTPIVNPPEVAIVGINRIATRPLWDGAQFQPRKMMNISASFDHRVIDGWNAASFLQKLKVRLETPAMIFMDEQAPG